MVCDLWSVHSKPHSTERPAPSSLGPRTLKNPELKCSRLEASADCRLKVVFADRFVETTLILKGLGPGPAAELVWEPTLGGKPTSTTKEQLRGSKLERKRKSRRLVERLLLRGSRCSEKLDGRVGKGS